MPDPTPQQLADRVNLGAHQGALEAEDENGQIQKFVVHRPTMRDQLRIGVVAAELTSTPTTARDGVTQPGHAVPVGDLFAGLAEAVATLNVVVDLRPAGLPADAGDWTDAVLVGNLYTAFGVWLDSFRPGVPAAVGGDSAAS